MTMIWIQSLDNYLFEIQKLLEIDQVVKEPIDHQVSY